MSEKNITVQTNKMDQAPGAVRARLLEDSYSSAPGYLPWFVKGQPQAHNYG